MTLPGSGHAYVDSPTVIYTVQNHPVYAALCRPLWHAARAGTVTVVTSELTLLETLVGPIRSGDVALRQDFEAVLLGAEVVLLAITREVLLGAARLRAEAPALRTPDAIHAATARVNGCRLILTNDRGIKRVQGLSVTVLDEVIAASGNAA